MHRVLHLHGRLLDIVLDAIQQRALVNDQSGQILEQLGQLCDRFRDFRQLTIADVEILVRRDDEFLIQDLIPRLRGVSHARIQSTNALPEVIRQEAV